MVCFTDIPLRYSEKHCSLFGKFGVGFNKNKFVEYGANPVLYLTSTHNSRISEVNSLINRLLSENVDREWRQQVDRYQFTEEQLFSLSELFSFSQEYKYNHNNINYYQREWRIGYETLTPKTGGNPTIAGQCGIRGIVNDKMRCEMKFILTNLYTVRFYTYIQPNWFYSSFTQMYKESYNLKKCK